MQERISTTRYPLEMTPGCYRIPDGHVVPHPPRHLPPAEQPPPVTYAERWWAAVFVGLVLAAIAVGQLIR